jgi:segregation and condensation protein B
VKGITVKKRRYLEAILFASEGVVSRQKLQRALTLNERQLDALIDDLKNHYKKNDSSLRVFRTSTHVSLGVQDNYLPFIKNFIEAEFSGAVLKTLAMIAFKSPVKQSTIIQSRGNKSYGHINELVASNLVEAEQHGNTRMLRLTPKFFKYFNITEKDFKDKLKEEKN